MKIKRDHPVLKFTTLSILVLSLIFLQTVATYAGNGSYYRITSASGAECSLNTNSHVLHVDFADAVIEGNAEQDFWVQAENWINGVLTETGSEFFPAGYSLYNTGAGNIVFGSVMGYPVTAEARIVSEVNGTAVHTNIVIITCTADGAGTVQVFNSGAGSASVCAFAIPSGAVQGRLTETAQAYYAPSASAATTFSIPAGTAWYILDTENNFTQLYIACNGNPVWVNSMLVGAP